MVFFQNLVNALQWGSFYALIALGYSMVYSILMLFNFAHGDVFMVGAYIGFFISTGLLSLDLVGVLPLPEAVVLGLVLVLTLAIAAFPANLEPAVVKAIVGGGFDKLREAGVALLGGHTVQDEDLKFGLAVVGRGDRRGC